MATSAQPYNDQELLKQLYAGEKGAFSLIFKEFYTALCAFAEKLTGSPEHAEDIVEDVFLKIWTRQQQFDDLHHLKNFLYKTTRNGCFDHLRRQEHRIHQSPAGYDDHRK